MSTPALYLCKPGYEGLLARELESREQILVARGAGWACCEGSELAARSLEPAQGLCFATATWPSVAQLQAGSVKRLAEALAELLVERLGQRQVDAAWPLVFMSADEESLAEHRKLVEERTRQAVRKRRARVLRLALEGALEMEAAPWGFYVFVTARGRAFASDLAVSGGQRRMRQAREAPSRSYLKVEEAFALFDRAPGPEERVVDLGAAPGGWSFAAAERGARVVAVDNGPLKGGAADNAHIQHRRSNAFTFEPEGRCDWLLCDMIESPAEVLGLLERWLGSGWCRHFVVNLKFGRGDPIPLLQQVGDERRGLASLCERLIARQLFHDRDELTLMGTRAG